jgi:hypothetical protein
VIAALTLAVSAVPAQAAPTAISTVAGSGPADLGTTCDSGGFGGFGGDGLLATDARLNCPRAVAPTPGGGFLIADRVNKRVRRVWPDGTITTVAGIGSAGFTGDGGPATQAELSGLMHDLAPTPDAGFVISDTANQRVRYVSPTGTIATIAGSGPCCGVGNGGFSGDNGPATLARLDNPHGLWVNQEGSYLIADTDNNRIRRVATDGTITTLAGSGPAGNGNGGFAGDGGPATSARLNRPFEVAATPDGGFLIADTANDVVRWVSPAGTIATVAGVPGQKGFAGDGGPATQALLGPPTAVAPSPGGGFLIADDSNERIRAVAPDGTITTIAGSGPIGVNNGGFAGDGGPATQALLNRPKELAVTLSGDVMIADESNQRIRLVNSVAAPAEKAALAALAVEILKNLRVRRGARGRLSYTSTLAAQATLIVRDRGGPVAHLRGQASPGRNTFILLPKLTRKLNVGKYRLVLALDADGQHGSVDAKLRIRPRRP